MGELWRDRIRKQRRAFWRSGRLCEGGRAPFSRLWREGESGVAHALLAFLCGEEAAAATDFDPLRRFSRNLSYDITETEESDRYGEEVSAPAAHRLPISSIRFNHYSSSPSPFHPRQRKRRCWRPHKHLIKATRLRDHHSCCASVALSFLPTR